MNAFRTGAAAHDDIADGSSAGIFAQRYDANRVAQGTETQVNSFTTGNQAAPAIASLAGGYVVVWQSSGQDGSSDLMRVLPGGTEVLI